MIEFTIQLTDTTADRLVEITRARSITESSAIEDALLFWLEDQEEGHPGPVSS